MASAASDDGPSDKRPDPDGVRKTLRQETLLKTGALQDAIFNSAYFSSIATDQIFNVGGERMLGYAALDVINKIRPADISDPQELIARAAALSLELDTAITPGRTLRPLPAFVAAFQGRRA